MKVYILEDETNILNHIISLVQNIPYLQLVGHAAEISKAEAEMPVLKPDIILADIQLKDGNSFTLFRTIQTDAHLIFITAYNQYAIEALNIGAFAYMVKPIETALFTETIDRCYKKTETYKFERTHAELAETRYQSKTKPQRIAIRNFDYAQIVQISDILYCQGNKGYTTFYLKDGSKITVSKVLKEYEDLFADNHFMRCHQSYLINTYCIKKYYRDGQLEMSNGDMIPVSDRRRQAVLNFFERIV